MFTLEISAGITYSFLLHAESVLLQVRGIPPERNTKLEDFI